MKHKSFFKKICFCILIISVLSSIGITAYAADAGNSIFGDVNGDGYVTNLDRYALNRYLAGKTTLADNNAADINRDGKITADDLDILSKHLANYQGYQNLNDFAVELNISDVTIDKTSVIVGESVTLTVKSNRPSIDIITNVDVYLDGSAIDHISGGAPLQYAPISEGNYSFHVLVNDRNGNVYEKKLIDCLEVDAPAPKLEDPVLMYPNLPNDEDDNYPYFDDDFTLRWNEIEGAVSYTIKFSLYEDGDWEEEETIEGITEPFYEMCYEDAFVNVGKCEFEIFAYDKNGNSSVSDFYYFQWGDNDDIMIGGPNGKTTWTTSYEESTKKSIWVECNSWWEADTSDDWISLRAKYTEGDGVGKVYFDIEENSGDFPRTGTIIITNENGGKAVFTIVQGPDNSSNQGYYEITYPEYGEVIDYDDFYAEWEEGSYHHLTLKDMTSGKVTFSKKNIYGDSYEIPKSALTRGHIYQLTITYCSYNSSNTSDYSVVFQVEGDSEDYEDIGGGSGTRGDTGNDEGATSIILNGLTDGTVVTKNDLHISWEEVLGAYEYNIALRDLTSYPDSLDEKNVVKAVDLKIDDLSYIISSGKLTEGHSYRLWVAAMKSDGTVLVGKTFRFSVKAATNSGTPSTDFNTASTQHTTGDPFKFEGTVLANGGTLEYIQITISEASTGKYCDYAIYDASALGNASSFNLSGIYNILTGAGSSVQTSGSRYARAGSQTLTLNQAGARYTITIYARNKGQGSNTIIATKNIELVAKPYINVYDENGNSLNGKTISVGHSAFSNKKIFVETNMNIAAWADSSKAFSLVLSETKYTANGTLYTYTIKGAENPSGSARSGELRIYQSDSGKVTSTSTMLASIKVNQSGNPNMPVVTGASIKDGNTTYNLNNDLVLKVGDHNYNNGYTLIVNMSNSASVNWTVYTDDFRVARAYRDSNGKVYVNANALGTTALYISHKYADSYDKVDPSTLIKICDIIVEKPKNDSQMADELAEAVMIPYLYDYLDAESGYDDVSQPLLFILEVMAKGIVGTAEFEISEAIRNSDVGLDGGHEIVHAMIFNEMKALNDDWSTFLKEIGGVGDKFSKDLTTERAQALYIVSQMSDEEYLRLLNDTWTSADKNINDLRLVIGGEDLKNLSLMEEYRALSNGLSTKTLTILSNAGKVANVLGKGINLINTGTSYFFMYMSQDEVDQLIDSWILATDNEELIAELKAYKSTYKSIANVIATTYVDSGVASSDLKEFLPMLAKGGAFGKGIQKLAESWTNSAFLKVINSADSFLTVSNLISKYVLGVDADAVYTAVTNLLVIDPIYRDLIEEICAYEDEDYYMHDSYINKVKLAAALAKLEYKYCIDIFKNDMAIPFNDKKESIQKVIDEYTAYSNTITETLDDFIAYIYSLRAQ